MNHKRTGKGKGKHIEDYQHKKQAAQAGANFGIPPVEEPVYPGALKRNIHVMAPMRNSNKYLLAKIIEVRIQRNGEEDEEYD